MSEIAEYSTTIKIPPSVAKRVSIDSNILDKDPRIEILKRALEIVAHEHGGTLTKDVKDCDGKRIDCFIGISLDDLPLGIGVNVDGEGRVHFIYDSYGDKRNLGKRICDEISQNYNIIALRLALMEMDYQVSIEEKKIGPYQKRVLVLGRI